MSSPTEAAAKALAGAKKIEELVESTKKLAAEPLKEPLPAGADATVAPLVKELLAKLEAIKASVKKYEEQVGKFAARAR